MNFDDIFIFKGVSSIFIFIAMGVWSLFWLRIFIRKFNLDDEGKCVSKFTSRSLIILTIIMYLYSKNIGCLCERSHYNVLSNILSNSSIDNLYMLIKSLVNTGVILSIILLISGLIINFDNIKKSKKETVFERVLITNIIFSFFCGKVVYSVQLIAILLGKFIWIGTDIKEIIKTIKKFILKDKNIDNADIISVYLLFVVTLCTGMSCILYKLIILVWGE